MSELTWADVVDTLRPRYLTEEAVQRWQKGTPGRHKPVEVYTEEDELAAAAGDALDGCFGVQAIRVEQAWIRGSEEAGHWNAFMQDCGASAHPYHTVPGAGRVPALNVVVYWSGRKPQAPSEKEVMRSLSRARAFKPLAIWQMIAPTGPGGADQRHVRVYVRLKRTTNSPVIMLAAAE